MVLFLPTLFYYINYYCSFLINISTLLLRETNGVSSIPFYKFYRVMTNPLWIWYISLFWWNLDSLIDCAQNWNKKYGVLYLANMKGIFYAIVRSSFINKVTAFIGRPFTSQWAFNTILCLFCSNTLAAFMKNRTLKSCLWNCILTHHY